MVSRGRDEAQGQARLFDRGQNKWMRAALRQARTRTVMEQERLSAGTAPATPKKKRRWLGTVIAVLLVAGLGALAWHLTHKPATGAAGEIGRASCRERVLMSV